MAEITSTSKRVTAISMVAARLSFLSGVTALVLLAALHVLSPEFDPSWRMVSEYALGDYGWVLSLMFLTWATSCVMLFFAVKSQIRTVGGKIGLVFLLAAAVGQSMAAFFDVRHNLHGLSAFIGAPSLPIAAMLISSSLVRNQTWVSVRRSLLWTANLTWISLALFIAAMFIAFSQTGGEFGPGILIGWFNRLWVTAYCVWLITVARLVIRIHS
jgi:hypothetical protein